jgi:hypothetical protein
MMIKFAGKLIDVALGRTDFASQYGTDSLVYFAPDGETDQVFVDIRASDSYAKYAAIHECICQGRCKHLAPKVNDPDMRCSEIDKMIIAAMPESERKAYIKKRIEMFKTLINKNLNPQLTPMFKKSLEALQSLTPY